MNPHRIAIATPLALALALGCATVPGGDREPGALLRQAEAAIENGEHEEAYDLLVRIRERHPDSPESAEAFPLAAALFKHFYWRHRFVAPETSWVTTAPGFLFAWVADGTGDGYPQEQMETLFRGMPFGIFRTFADFAAEPPRLAAYTFEVEKDNGIIESITAVSRTQATQ